MEKQWLVNKTNKDFFWRRYIRPLHRKGFSRLQSTLDEALVLMNSVGGASSQAANSKQVTELVNGIYQSIIIPSSQEKEKIDSFDSLKSQEAKLTYQDRYNGAALFKSIATLFQHQIPAEPTDSMVDRHTIFKDNPNPFLKVYSNNGSPQ